MGHQRIGTLPATRKWNAVIALITGGASANEVAAQTAIAAERSLLDASRNPALRYAFWLLTQIPLAARASNFGEGLRRLGLQVGDAPNLVEIGSAMLVALDRVGSRARRIDDLSEIASTTATESLMMVASRSGESLFGSSYAAEDALISLRGLSTNRQFGVLARDFIGRLIRRFSDYFLSRALPLHVGINKRFQSLKDHHRFNEALTSHCHETSLIVERFACDWFSKANYEGGVDLEKAGGFLHVALKKVRAELEVRRAVSRA